MKREWKVVVWVLLVQCNYAMIFDQEDPLFERIGSNEPIANEWIAAFRDGYDCKEMENEIKNLEFKDQQLASRALPKRKSSEALNVDALCLVSFGGSREFADEIALLDQVEYVEENRMLQVLQAPPSWGLSRIMKESLPLSKQPFQAEETGKKVNIFIIDTGIAQHPEFGRRLKKTIDFTGSHQHDGTDGNGHGTHCAGTAAGSTYGIARDAHLFGVRVLNDYGSGSTVNVIKGIQWAVNYQQATSKRRKQTAVMSLSLGGSIANSLDRAINAAAKKNFIVTVAAGNSNEDACYFSPARTGGNGRGMGPLTVGATDQNDNRASYSNYGNCVDIFAPGTSITSAWIRPSLKRTISGTSMAAPHVAGIAALLLEKHRYNKEDAQNELLSVTAFNQIKDTKGSPNMLAQISTYSGGPTLQPTTPPTFEPSSLVVGGQEMQFLPSTFGPNIPFEVPFQLRLVYLDNDGCIPFKGRFKNKILVIPRGNCRFHDKVVNAQNANAAAVIFAIQNPVEDVTRWARPNHYTADYAKIPSLMIKSFDGIFIQEKLKKRRRTVAFLGSQDAAAFKITKIPKDSDFSTRVADENREVSQQHGSDDN